MYKKFYEFCRRNVHISTCWYFLKEIKNLILYHQIEPRQYIVSKEKKVIYLRNPKVANSSIKTSLYSGEAKDDYSIHSIVVNTGMQKVKLSAEELDYFKFTYVRNPFERLVSCYESKYHADKIKYKDKDKLLYFDSYLLGYIRKDKGFDNFIKRIIRLPYWCMDRHFFPQYYWTHDERGQQLLDYIGQYENLEEDFKKIQEKYGLKPLPHYNSSGGEKRDWRSYYTLETAKLVYEKYKKDIECFGYEDSYKDLIAYLKTEKTNNHG